MFSYAWARVIPLMFLFALTVQAGVEPVAELVIVEAPSGNQIMVLSDGDVVDVDTFPSSQFTIQANFDSSVESVKFGVDGNPGVRTESAAPYVISGDFNGVFNPYSLPLGVHTITATPFPADFGGGVAGDPISVTFSLVNLGGDPLNPPQIVSDPPENATFGQLLSYQLDVEDADPGDLFTYEVVAGPGSIDGSGFYSYVPTLFDVGPLFIEIEVTDLQDLTTTQGFTVEVETDGTEAQALLQVTPGPSLLFTSTFASDSLKVTNLSLDGQKIVSFTLDLSTCVMPDILFDPTDGSPAGDIGSNCFTENPGDAFVTGLIEPNDPCSSPFSLPSENGFQAISLEFDDFEPGETFAFAIDIDPSSIQNAPTGGQGGEISGFELSGATITVNFDDDTTAMGQLFQFPSSELPGKIAGAQVLAKLDPVAAPTLEVIGVNAPDEFVDDVDQTAVISGPAGMDVSLVVVEGYVDIPPGTPGGGFDLELFEINTAQTVQTFDAVIGVDGDINIPFTLSENVDELGSLYYLFAVIRDADQPACTSLVSNRIRLDFMPPAALGAPEIVSMSPTTGQVGVDLAYTAVAVDPNMDEVSFSFLGPAPAGATIDSVTGLLSWIPAPSQTGFQSLTIRATDSTFLTDDQFVALCISPVDNTMPIITSVDPMAVISVGQTFEFDVNATDVDGCDTVEYFFGNAPSSATIDSATGLVSFTPSMAGVFPIQVIATDNNGGMPDMLILNVEAVQPEERIILVDAATGSDLFDVINGQVIDVDVLPSTYSFRAEFPDASVESVLFGLDGNGSFRIESVAPYALNGDSGGLYFPIDLSLGEHTINATPFSGNGASGTAGMPVTVTFTIAELGVQSPPMITSTPPMTVEVGETFTYELQVEDLNPSDTFIYDLLVGPGSLDATGVYTFVPTALDEGPIGVTVQVTDSTGLMDDQMFVFDVVVPVFAPEITSLPPTEASVGTRLSYVATAVDPMGDPSLLVFSLEGAAPMGAAIDPSSGAVSWTPGPGQIGIQSLVIRVTDPDMLFEEQVVEVCVSPEFNSEPVIDTVVSPLTSVGTGQALGIPFEATDIDPCDTIEFDFDVPPPLGASIDPLSGAFSFQSDLEGLFDFEVVAIDNLGGVSDPVLFSIDVVAPIARFVLVDANSNQDIGVLFNGQTIDLDALPSENISIRAEFDESVESVLFGVDGNSVYRIESVAPYAVQGDFSGNYTPFNPGLGTHTITATPFSLDSAQGQEGPSIEIDFTLTENGGEAPVSPPVITSDAPSSVNVGETLVYPLAVDDPNTPESFTFAVTSGPGSINASGVYMISPSVAGPQVVTIEVTDSTGLTATQTFNLLAVPGAGALFQVTPNNDLDSAVVDSDSFIIENTSTNGQSIEMVTIDLSSTVLFDLVFDPTDGTPAGDTLSSCLVPNAADEATTGFVAFMDPCVEPFFDGQDDGFQKVTLVFNDFGPGESFSFSVDVDPTSIQGATVPGANDPGGVAGLELVGASIDVLYDDGSLGIGHLFPIPGAEGGSQALVKVFPSLPPTLQLSNSMGGLLPSMALVTGTDLTADLAGPPNGNVTLVVLEGVLDVSNAPGGGFDLDGFEMNDVGAITSIDVVLDSMGVASVPVTLDEQFADSQYAVFAALRDSLEPECSGVLSSVFYLDVIGGTVSMAAAAAEVGVEFNLDASTGDTDQDPAIHEFLGPVPAGVVIDPVTGLITWIPGQDQTGRQILIVRATGAGSIAKDQVIEVCVSDPLLNVAPTIVSIAPQAMVATGDTFSFQVAAVDPDPCDTVRFALGAGAPSGTTLDVLSGEVVFETTIEGLFFIDVVAIDSLGDVSAPFPITVDVTDPSIVDTSARLDILTDNLNASTFNPGSFVLTNTSFSGAQITAVSIDLSTALFPDLVFDPTDGTPAGDTTQKCVEVEVGATSTGYILNDPCSSPFSAPNDSGFYTLELDFANFEPGEVLVFSIDIDPTSIQSTVGSGGAGSVSGLELSGAEVTVTFSNGLVLTNDLMSVPGSEGSATVTLSPNVPADPVIVIPGFVSPGLLFDSSQTIEVLASPFAEIRLLVVEGDLEGTAPLFDVEPFEANTAVAVDEYSVFADSSGVAQIPVDLVAVGNDGLFHMLAAEVAADGTVGRASNLIVVEIDSIP